MLIRAGDSQRGSASGGREGTTWQRLGTERGTRVLGAVEEVMRQDVDHLAAGSCLSYTRGLKDESLNGAQQQQNVCISL